MPIKRPRPWREVVASWRVDRNGVHEVEDTDALSAERRALTLPRWYHTGTFSTKSRGVAAAMSRSPNGNDAVLLAIEQRVAQTIAGSSGSESQYLSRWLVELLKQSIANMICREDLHGRAMRLVDDPVKDSAQPSSSSCDVAVNRSDAAAPLQTPLQMDLAVRQLLSGDTTTFGLRRRSTLQQEEAMAASEGDTLRNTDADSEFLWCARCSALDRTIRVTDVVNSLGLLYELSARGGPKTLR